MRWLLAVLACAVGCSGVPEAIEPGREYVLSTSGPWTEEEISELSAACVAWSEASRGKLACRLGSEEESDATFVRGTTGVAALGKVRALERALTIDADAIYARGFGARDGVGAMARNLLGLAAGLPNHEECGVLGRRCVEPEFSAADLAVCRAAGFC